MPLTGNIPVLILYYNMIWTKSKSAYIKRFQFKIEIPVMCFPPVNGALAGVGLPVIIFLLWANVGRSWKIGGTLFYEERGLIGAGMSTLFRTKIMRCQNDLRVYTAAIDTEPLAVG